MKHITVEDMWEIYETYRRDVYPDLSAVDLKVLDKSVIERGIRKAKDFLSTIGASYEETHVRSIVEEKIQRYRNMLAKRLKVRDILLENAFAASTEQILTRGLKSAAEMLEAAFEAVNEIKRGEFAEVKTNATELGEKFKSQLKEIWAEIEKTYEEKVELVLENHHDRRYALMVGEGKIVFGTKNIHAYYWERKHTLIPRWKVIVASLLEEYLHIIHYRRIRDLPPIFVNYRPHSEEIWAYLEVERRIDKPNVPLSDIELKLLNLDGAAQAIGTTEAIAKKLADLLMFNGDLEDAKQILKEYIGIPVERYDWDLYLRSRMKELQMIVEDPREYLEYRMREALYYSGKTPMEEWLRYGKICSRAMELLGLI